MKIKAISHIATLAITIATLGSCSNIDSDDRLIYVKPAPVKRTVLIEDFTGQKCINCPYAANETEKIITQYGQENIIVVSIHCGLGMNYNPTARYQGLMTTTGNQYYKAWGSPAQPSGLVNRTTAEATTYTTWGSLVRNEIQQTAPIAISLATQYNPDDRHLDIDVKVSGTDGNTDGYLQVWLTEDNIISLQDTPQGRDYQYNHRHAFRANVTPDLWGDAVSITEGQSLQKNYSYILPTHWNPQNISVVAFVTDTRNQNVKQATAQPITEKITPTE